MFNKAIIKSIVVLTVIAGAGVALTPTTSDATTCNLVTPVTGTTSASCDIPITASVGKAIAITASPDPVTLTTIDLIMALLNI